ncbi:fatty acid desaturase [bacterium]|nr:fatty acid desaturase [bacterium]
MADFHHLRKIERYGRVATALGYATAPLLINPLSAFLISLGHFTRWLLVHHISHRGYDKVPGVPQRYTSKHFARGWRRYIDWFDWIEPNAWDHEHNYLHHYHTGEDDDPDLTQRHAEFLRRMPLPYFLKYIIILLIGMTWKYTYYAPNTMSVLDPETRKRLKKGNILFITVKNIFQFQRKSVRQLWLRCYLPYGVVHFAVIPALFLPFGTTAAWCVLVNKLLAECITNFHSFLVIAPNHSADDLYRFHFHYDNKEEFYLTQVLGSANYHCGDEFTDYMSIWLNYQIEHHLFPDLPMTKYREIQPKVKTLCQKYGIPYIQESIFKRFKRMLDITVGKTSMRELTALPEKPPPMSAPQIFPEEAQAVTTRQHSALPQ